MILAMRMRITLNINGIQRTDDAEPRMPLIHVKREAKRQQKLAQRKAEAGPVRNSVSNNHQSRIY